MVHRFKLQRGLSSSCTGPLITEVGANDLRMGFGKMTLAVANAYDPEV